LDGQPVVVGSIAEARELLAAVREQVAEKVQRAVSVSRAITVKPGKLSPKVIAKTPDKAIRRVVNDAQKQYDRLVRDAIAQAMREEEELIVMML
jgi:O-acetyl-ADP-ribose deacetylase (regulator of RNase III)